ncbi:MAG: signal peptidase [Actinomycetota bacterium]|jgi:signal peptidase I|nr:peptidase signal peptidase [Cryptosporangiaceae bacterium]MDQ1679139.1 signal peptidase [Actinomycetota bacterium]
MRTHRAVLVLLAAVVTVAGWFVLAPPVLGGTTSYVVTHGTSMEPSIHTGDLALVRPAEQYGPGDVIAYRSPTLRTVVLHRIVAADTDGFVTKGDNNGWRDPDHPGSGEVIGRLWIHVPKAGAPLAAGRGYAGPAILVLIFLFIAGGGSVTRSRRRKRGGAVHRRLRSRRLTSPLLAWAAALFLAATALGVLAFTRDAGPPAGSAPAYSQQVSLGYAAHGDPEVYDGGRLRTGDPVFLALTPRLDVDVTYEISAAQLTYAGGRIGLVARVSGVNGWQRSVSLVEPRMFSGARAHLATRVNLTALRKLIDTMQRRTGATDGTYVLELVPQVHATPTIDGRSVVVDYAPAIRFQLQPTQLILDNGARHVRGRPIGARSERSDTAGPAQLALLGRQLPLRTARIASVGLGVVALVVAGTGLLWRRDAIDPVARLGRPVIPVDAAELDRPAVDVAGLDALLDIAERYDRPLLHARAAGITAYLVEENGTWYRHRIRTPAARAGHLRVPPD